ncbi:E3 ubiquitin- ligase RNF26-like [Paramuricea clavata]|uniref:E3 ubiquitin- ligase RNF26-like n=1 Tax=Paramuricea clavata TaxID=317549 RepID=A0A7D9ESX5_PARCT|nr:E3 ubiquitin- ligase RNF26-like [Paramuricea clavata]
MSAKGERILLVVFLFGITSVCLRTLAVKVEPYSSQAKAKQSINLNHPEIASTFKRFEENAPTLIKLLQAICEVLFAGLWILDTSLNAFLWLLNETVGSCTDLCSRIFGILINVVKLLEAFGFVVKFLLELNYTLLSYIFDTFGCLRAGLHDAVTLVKITIANQTEHMYESSSMALEGVQNLFLTACNQTWVNVRYISSIVTTNFTPPFGLSALDFSLLVSMFLAGLEFFVESVKMSGVIFKDGNIFLLNYIYGTLCKVGGSVLEYIVAFVCCIRDAVTMVTTQILYTVTLPFYFLASIVSNILRMLYYSWQAFVNWVGYIDSSIREIMYSILQTIGLGLSSLVCNIKGGLYNLIYTITRCLSGLVYVIIGAISSIVYGITGFITAYIPGGFLGCIALASILTVLYLWHKEITSLLVSSWISLRRMNENARPIAGEHQPFNDEQDFDIQGVDIAARNMPEPPLDREMPQNQTKLNYELEREKDKRLCVICQDNVKNILLMPCRHVCMCQQCLNEIRQGRVQLAQCPLCRTQIQSTLEVFV